MNCCKSAESTVPWLPFLCVQLRAPAVLHGMVMIYPWWCDSALAQIHRRVVWSWWNVPFQICSISRTDEIGNRQSQRPACPSVMFPLLSCPICRHGPSLPSQFYRWCRIYTQAYLRLAFVRTECAQRFFVLILCTGKLVRSMNGF